MTPITPRLVFGSLLASWLVETGAGAQPQDALGQAHDAPDISQAPMILAELRLTGDLSAAPATMAINADLYGETDSEDWYVFTLRDDAISSDCFQYRRKMQARLTGVTQTGSAQLRLQIMRPPNALLSEPNTAPGLALLEEFVSSCGSSSYYLLPVRRILPFSASYPVAYTLDVKVEREFFPPRIDSISPLGGSVGDAVTITGERLLPSVSFQGIAAQIVQFAPNTIIVTVPPGAHTGPITVFSTTSTQSFAVNDPRLGAGATTSLPPKREAPGRTGPTSPTPPREAPAAPAGAGSCCVTKPNPALAGRLGRLVVAFPAEAVPTATKVAVLKDGREVQAGYGSQAFDLLAGTYELSISGKKIGNVSIQARSDTNVRVGVLRVSAADQTRTEIVDGDAVIASGYGERLVGLPAGTYGLRISGQTESFTISDGQVTDF
jgi:IPT/TIG domain-containing protein